MRIANDSPYGLSGTVFSADDDRAQAVAARMRVGTVNVNGGVWYSADAAFGGYKQSGIGREMGVPGFEEYLETKLIATAANKERSVGLYGDQFKEKVAIVTGSGGGIGQAYAEALAREGAAVVVADINTEGAQKVADGIKGEGGTALALRVDVSDPESAKEMAAATLAEFGDIDHLVNNAAIYGDMELNLLLTVPWDYYKKFMSVNLDGALNIAARCGNTWPRTAAAHPRPDLHRRVAVSTFYGLAKVGINGLTQQLAHELGGSKIRVNAIAPGPIDTEATRKATPEPMVKDLVETLAIKRIGTPEDLVGACLFLLSDEANWITGHILNVDGGQISGHERRGRLHRTGQYGRAHGQAPAGLARRPGGVRHPRRGGRAVHAAGRPRCAAGRELATSRPPTSRHDRSP